MFIAYVQKPHTQYSTDNSADKHKTGLSTLDECENECINELMNKCQLHSAVLTTQTSTLAVQGMMSVVKSSNTQMQNIHSLLHIRKHMHAI